MQTEKRGNLVCVLGPYGAVLIGSNTGFSLYKTAELVDHVRYDKHRAQLHQISSVLLMIHFLYILYRITCC